MSNLTIKDLPAGWKQERFHTPRGTRMLVVSDVNAGSVFSIEETPEGERGVSLRQYVSTDHEEVVMAELDGVGIPCRCYAGAPLHDIMEEIFNMESDPYWPPK